MKDDGYFIELATIITVLVCMQAAVKWLINIAIQEEVRDGVDQK